MNKKGTAQNISTEGLEILKSLRNSLPYIRCQNDWTLTKNFIFVTTSKPFLSSGCVGDLAQLGDKYLSSAIWPCDSVSPFIRVICDPEEDKRCGLHTVWPWRKLYPFSLRGHNRLSMHSAINKINEKRIWIKTDHDMQDIGFRTPIMLRFSLPRFTPTSSWTSFFIELCLPSPTWYFKVNSLLDKPPFSLFLNF